MSARHLLIFATCLPLALAGCPKRVTPDSPYDKEGHLKEDYQIAEILFVNSTGKDVQVSWQSWAPPKKLGDKEGLVVNDSKSVKATASTSAPEALKLVVAKGGRVEMNYRPGGAELDLPTLDVPQTPMHQEVILPPVQAYDADAAKKQLEDLAAHPEAKLQKQAQGRTLDAVRADLGALLFVEGPNNDIVDRVYLQDVDLKPPAEPFHLDGSTVLTLDVMSKLSVTIPIYADLKASMSAAKYYSVMWSLKYYPLDNGSFRPSAALSAARPEQLSQILLALRFHPKASLKFIREGTVIRAASFSSSEGTEFKSKADSSIVSMVNAGVSYAFLQKNEKTAGFSDLVVDIALNPGPDRQELERWLVEQLKPQGTRLSPPKEDADPSKSIHIEPQALDMGP